MGLIPNTVRHLSSRAYQYFAPTYDKNYFIEQLKTYEVYQLAHLKDRFKGREDEAIEWLCEIISNNNPTELRCKALDCIFYFTSPKSENLKKETQERLTNVLLNCLDDPSDDIKICVINSCYIDLSLKNLEYLKKFKELSNSTNLGIFNGVLRFLPYFEDLEAIQILKRKLSALTLKLELGTYSWDDIHTHHNLCEALENAYTSKMGNDIYGELKKISKASSLEKEKLRQAFLEKCDKYTKIYGRRDVTNVLASYFIFNNDEELKKEALNCLCSIADKAIIIEALSSAFNYKFGPSYAEAHQNKFLSLQAGFALASKEKGISVPQLINEEY